MKTLLVIQIIFSVGYGLYKVKEIPFFTRCHRLCDLSTQLTITIKKIEKCNITLMNS